MIPANLQKRAVKHDGIFYKGNVKDFVLPKYDPKTHVLELTKSGYYRALIFLRSYLKAVSDYYFGERLGGSNVDLFMLTPTVSSPTGPGSDSEVIPIKFGKYDSFLVDSSQFGFEPLLMNEIDLVYCYLPSMRGESPDKRHLNQFYHCEAEMRGDLEKLIPLVEGYVKALAEMMLLLPNICKKMSANYTKTNSALTKLLRSKVFPRISFDEAVNLLIESGNASMVRLTPKGRDISPDGEVKLAEMLSFDVPFWIYGYDRDRVPFYQKPMPKVPDKVINADLIFPPLVKGSFGGEIVGCGQRQDTVKEIKDSLKRQGLSSVPYQWYIDLRKQPHYSPTSGFGLGIERFITWSLCRDDIRQALPYPRLKNVKTYP